MHMSGHTRIVMLTRESLAMNDIDLQTFYEWLDTYPDGVIQWEIVDVQEGLRVVNFYVQEEDDD